MRESAEKPVAAVGSLAREKESGPEVGRPGGLVVLSGTVLRTQ